MLRVPPEIVNSFESQLAQHNIAPNQRFYFHKWLRLLGLYELAKISLFLPNKIIFQGYQLNTGQRQEFIAVI